jgi:hypothetical protein
MTFLAVFLILVGSILFAAGAMAFALQVPVQGKPGRLRAALATEAHRLSPSRVLRKPSRSGARAAVGTRRARAAGKA